MKRNLFFIVVFLLFIAHISCAPVLKKETMDAGIRDVPVHDLTQNPLSHKGAIFIMGGVIIDTKLTHEGSLVEALYVPVDSRGHLKDTVSEHFRYLALFPKGSGILDPVIFEKDREITLAGEFRGTRKAKLDEIDYIYPFFVIKEVYLWEEKKQYLVPYPYYDPWWGYPYWYGPPYGWRHPYHPYWW